MVDLMGFYLCGMVVPVPFWVVTLEPQEFEAEALVGIRYRQFFSVTIIMVGLYLGSAEAQQTIFNVPSADVTPKGEIFLQHESQFRTWRPGRFINSTEYSAYGLGHGTELDVTVFNVNAPASDNITLGVGLKKSVPLFPRRFPRQELKLTVGQLIPVSLQGQGVGNWSYAHLSTRAPRLKTRVAVGVSTGTRQIFGRTTVGAIATLEQPVTKRLSLQGDWYSGTHALGFLIAGFTYALPYDTVLFGGYQIPNTPRYGRQGFVLEFARYLK